MKKSIFLFLFVLVGLFATGCLTPPRDWHTIEYGESVTIDDIVIKFSYREDGDYAFSINEAEGTENIGSYAFSSMGGKSSGTVTLTHDPKERVVHFRITEDTLKVAVEQTQ